METGWSTMAVNLEVEQMENTLPSKIMPGIMAERCQILWSPERKVRSLHKKEWVPEATESCRGKNELPADNSEIYASRETM